MGAEVLGTTMSKEEGRGPGQVQMAKVPEAGTSTQGEELVASGMQLMQTQLERFFQEVNTSVPFITLSNCYSTFVTRCSIVAVTANEEHG
ncbi:hypothetical protein L2V44_14110 [Staphylococcus aureus]|nr:hypothetical protein [Staphylococcus aureus]